MSNLGVEVSLVVITLPKGTLEISNLCLELYIGEVTVVNTPIVVRSIGAGRELWSGCGRIWLWSETGSITSWLGWDE